MPLKQFQDVVSKNGAVIWYLIPIIFSVKESASVGPIGLVSHGGPITFLLLDIGIDGERLDTFRKKFDRSNPLPPAGAWEATWNKEGDFWDLDLSFIPSAG